MKIESLKRLSSEDYPGIPEEFLDALNSTLEEFSNALQRKLSLRDNFNSEEKTVRLKDNTEKEIELKELKGNPVQVYARSHHFDYFTFTWAVSRPGFIKVKIAWDTDPGEAKDVTITAVGA